MASTRLATSYQGGRSILSGTRASPVPYPGDRDSRALLDIAQNAAESRVARDVSTQPLVDSQGEPTMDVFARLEATQD